MGGKCNHGRLCVIDGCENKAYDAGGMCGKHAQRVRRYGDPHYLTPEMVRRQSNRAAQLAKFGDRKRVSYPKLMGRHEHRVVAERMIGRTLETNEHVHHKNGNKSDNRPENLEVLTASEHAKAHYRDGRFRSVD